MVDLPVYPMISKTILLLQFYYYHIMYYIIMNLKNCFLIIFYKPFAYGLVIGQLFMQLFSHECSVAPHSRNNSLNWTNC